MLLTRYEVLRKLRQHLTHSQQQMKQFVDKHRQDRHFQVGNLVLVKLQPYRQSTTAHRVNSKLCKCFFDPFPVMAKVGSVAYTLQLPHTSRIHPTFHVSQLKLFKGTIPPNITTLPDYSLHNQPLLLPISILVIRIYSSRGRPVKQVLVQWSHSPPEDATWENWFEFCKIYQILDLEDKVNFEEGGSVSHVHIGLDSGEIKKNDRIIGCQRYEEARERPK